MRKWVCEVPGGWPSRGLTVGQATGTGPRSSEHNSTWAWHSDAFRDWTVRPEGGARACPSCWHLTGPSLSVGKEGLRVASPTEEAQRSPRSPRRELSEPRTRLGRDRGVGKISAVPELGGHSGLALSSYIWSPEDLRKP